MKNKGLFICFEGGEGAGKSTIVNELAKKLSPNYEVVTTREPGGSQIGDQIRSILVDENNPKIDPKTEALLFCADRCEHIKNVIKPALEAGKVVLCDRFVYSSVAYQGYGRGLGSVVINELNEWVLEDFEPDLIVYLKLNPQIGLNRVFKNRTEEINRIDNEDIKFHQRVVEGFDDQFRGNPKTLVIEATQSIEDITNTIFNKIKELL